MERDEEIGTADWVLVPRAPTTAMINAAWAEALAEDAAGVWKAMIEAIPSKAETQGQ